MPDRFPGYDVLSKRWTPSWNQKTREVMNRRLALPSEPRHLTKEEFVLVTAIAGRIVPQPHGRAPVPVAALLDHQLDRDEGDGYRQAGMPPLREAWRQGLAALNAEARAAFGASFDQLRAADQDALLTRMQNGELKDPAWGTISPSTFFKQRMARDIVHAYYAYPTAWNEIGWGGPASPRGYVRMGFNRRDPWEAAEVKDGDVETARRKNQHVG